MITPTRPALRFGRDAVAIITAATLCWATPLPALADESLESLQNAAITAADAYQQAQDQATQLQQQIDDNQQRIDELEAALPEQKAKAATAIRASYKMSQDQANLLTLLLSSEDFNQFVASLMYLDTVTQSNMDAIQGLAKTEAELQATRADLTSQKAAIDAKVAEAQSAYESAESARKTAERKAMENAAAAQAAYEAQQAAGQQDSTATEVAAATSGTSGGVSGGSNDSSNNANDSASDSSSADGSGSNASSDPNPSPSAPSGSYTYVGASTYGEGDGLMYSATASGDVVTPTSMGVAMKTMPLGTVIEITYNGRTTTAVVNDRGPYIAGREIDLQPAVAHALGFDGVGTVGYRVIG